MKYIKYSLILLTFWLARPAYSQSYISVQGSFNYWQHTELFGPGIGLGYHYKKDKFLVAVQYDFGYGTVNRLNSFDNVNYDRRSTVTVLREDGKWNGEIWGRSLDDIYELPGTTDYGKQHQLSLQVGYSVYSKNDVDYVVKVGAFGAIVEQFFTFKNIPVYNVNLVGVIDFPLNYIPVTTQKILTLGINTELSVNFTKNKRIISPFVAGGIGPQFGSYASVGLRLSTQLMKK